MEQHKLSELIYMYAQLKNIYKPSEKIKQSIKKLENSIHLILMSIKTHSVNL